jgi:putative hemolysin
VRVATFSLVPLFALAALAAAAAACGSGGTPDDSSHVPGPIAEDERGAPGVPSPASAYCHKLGFVPTDDGTCRYPDGTSCDQWAFYRAQCGQPFSYCNRHGGQVSSQERDMGGWTALVAVCTIDGKECTDESFLATGKCE